MIDNSNARPGKEGKALRSAYYSHGHPSSIVFFCRSSHFDAKFQMKIEIWHQNVMNDNKKTIKLG